MAWWCNGCHHDSGSQLVQCVEPLSSRQAVTVIQACTLGVDEMCFTVHSFMTLYVSSVPRCVSQIGCLPYFDTWCGLCVNLECRSEMYCTRLTENTGRKELPKIRHLGTIAQLCRAVSLQLRHVSTIGKNLLNSSISCRCPYNMLNFSPLTAEITLPVWGTPAHFNGFRVLAALLQGTLVVGVSQTLRRWKEGASYIWQDGRHVEHRPIL